MLSLDKLKKYKLPLMLMGTAGALLLLLLLFQGEDKVVTSQEQSYTATEQESNCSENYDTYLEAKLEDILSSTEGVGKVKVAVSLYDSGEIYPFTQEESSKEVNNEKDSAGGTRENTSESGKSQPSVIKNSDGSESVVITKSDMPRIQGVIVCAKGGDSYVVQERIINAVQALCNVDINSIQILPMS